MGHCGGLPALRRLYIVRRKEICAGLPSIGGRYTAGSPVPCENAPAESECTRGTFVRCRASPAYRPSIRSFCFRAFLRDSFVRRGNDLRFELWQKHCLVAVRTGRDHANLRSTLAFDEAQLFLG